MPSIISTKTTGGGGIAVTGDTSGVLELASANGTTAVTIDTNQRAAFVAGTAAAPAITTAGDTNTGMFFPAADTIAFAEGGVEAMRLDASGNVGIGTSSPNAKLNTAGIISTSGTDAGFVTYRRDTNASAFTMYSPSNVLAFYDNSAGTERMRIGSNGNLFIGTTTNPVSNAEAIINAVVSSGDGFNLKHTVNGNNMFNLWQTGTTTYTALAFNKGDTQTLRGQITVSTSSVAYNTTSDYRLKENVLPMTGALDTVAQLKPVTYNWKENGSNGQGFIAHELQEVVPDCVTGEKDAVDAEGNPVYQGIDTSFLVATLTAAIQELKAIVDTQAEQIKALQGASA